MTPEITIRPATKADASEVALLVNIATHGGIRGGWEQDERAEGTYDPLEVGRLDMLDETSGLNWSPPCVAAGGRCAESRGSSGSPDRRCYGTYAGQVFQM